ncbi:MAG: hypothetical protein HY906_20855, partial [Deltaproteobacteria bacterium]|nr:hypothetical protein [Deltaproteobacteria bacterium]
GAPLGGALVDVWIEPWGAPLEAFTDEAGRYVIKDVPVASPRYLLLASQAGYRTSPVGAVGVASCTATSVDFELTPGSDPLDDLRVKFGSTARVIDLAQPEFPPDAVIPADPTGYPDAVRPFLAPDEYVESEHPAVAALAAEILESVLPEERSSSRAVAWAVYSWVARNVEHDGVYQGADAPGRIITVLDDFKDVTSGIWQTVTGEGWSWGRSFYDWGYRPSETLRERGVICAEHAWLVAALLRHLRVPARAAVGYNQFWVQRPGGEGFWAYLSTTAGRGAYRTHGELGPGFGSRNWPPFYSVRPRPLLHEDWNFEQPGMWRELHPFEEAYDDTPEGLTRAVADLASFAATGEAPQGTPPASPPPSHIMIHHADLTLSLLSVGEQRVLDVRFPLISESPTHTLLGHEAYWTNHPECVIRTWVEEIANPPVEGVERWFHIEFDVTSLVDR